MIPTVAEAKAGVRQYREGRAGLGVAREDEWQPGWLGLYPDEMPIHLGTLADPEPDKPMLARFYNVDEWKWTPILAVKKLAPNHYINIDTDEEFDWDDSEVVIYSGISR